ncbi:MAG: hypothetical protein UU37_C0004G0012 [Candidatus Gottesmanbacteria bacterium GW2011_GWA2_41_12]|uniref:Uncharacterized protein n=1 Tax=Candidatus Gottesmanbacteria bacterium GW2011_GWA2_41_12 TaxID=1618440 RepID=A0A0G0UHT8_9BACT|nr:MAG: hypothetical protein UU37_C0004G0012 [Candidatus Gottesmanbacteria bacterium GW2011_GWA2_41_12]
MRSLKESLSDFKLKDLSKKVNPYIQNKKNASYFSLILSLISFSLFGIFAIKPTLSTASSLTKQISDARIYNSKLEEKINNLVKVQAEYEKIRQDIPYIYGALPDSSNFTKLALTLENIASISGTALEGLQFNPVSLSKEPKNKKLQNVGFIASLTGEYENMQEFINHIINNQRVIIIDEISIVRSNESTEGAKLKINLRNKSYYEY